MGLATPGSGDLMIIPVAGAVGRGPTELAAFDSKASSPFIGNRAVPSRPLAHANRPAAARPARRSPRWTRSSRPVSAPISARSRATQVVRYSIEWDRRACG
jgi:hypothetical protein